MNRVVMCMVVVALMMGAGIARAEIKEYVPIVKPRIHKTTEATFLSIAKLFEDKGAHEIAAIFEAFARGGH